MSGRKTARLRTLAAGYLLAHASLTACSFTYDADRKQCSTHGDCAALGVSAGACIDGLCQSSMQVIADSAIGPVSDVSAPPAAEVDAGGGVSVDASDGVVPPSQPGDGFTPDSGPMQPQDSGTSSDVMSVDAAAQVDSGPCSGPGCPECKIDADCAERSPGSICADGFCWSPAAQCKADADCAELGPEFRGGRCLTSQCRPNPRWRCERPAPVSITETKKLTALVRDSLSLNPLAGIRAQVCQKLDLQCTAPLTEATTQADGMLTFSVPANFAGYLKVDESTKYFPAMYSLPAALPMDGVLQPFPLLSAGLIVDALAITLGTGIDPRRGHMMLIAEDCMGSALPGVVFKSPQQDTRTVQFYVRDLLPSTSATQTAEIGNGGYLNFPAGAAVITLEQVASKLRLNTVSVVVRAGYISVAYIRPELR
ncbi:MAG TPA: hypothetical protein VFZ61_28355 [Polyangiales bacterium]